MFKKLYATLGLILAMPTLSYALSPIKYEDRLYYGREEFNDDEEGKLLFKLGILGLRTSAKPKNLPKATATNPDGIGKLFTSGIGGQAATTFYFTNNIAAELSLGMMLVRSHNKVLNVIAKNYSGKTPGKTKRMFLFPLTATVIYNIAPYGGIQTYVGVGGHATYVKSKLQNVDIKHGFGPVIQAGVDLVSKDYTFINLDVKQYLFSPKMTYKNPLVSSNFTSKIKLNPIVFSLNVGFKF